MVKDAERRGLTTRRVWEHLGLPASTLHHWVQLGLVGPSLRPPRGRRAEQLWTVEDVVVVRSVRELRRAQVPMKSIKFIVRQLRLAGDSLASLRLEVTGGRDVVLIDRNGDRTSARQPGQGVLDLMPMPLDRWHREADREAMTYNLADIRRRDRALDAIRAKRTQAAS